MGQRIDGIYVSDGENELLLQTDGPNVCLGTYGDCCSETWFADITGVTSLLDGNVKSIEALNDLPVGSEDRSRQDYDLVYGFRIHTHKGSGDIIFRNSSNGYYGGNIEPTSDLNPARMTRITSDWRA